MPATARPVEASRRGSSVAAALEGTRRRSGRKLTGAGMLALDLAGPGPAPAGSAARHNAPVDPIVRLEAYFNRLVSRPVAELSRAQRGLRFGADLVRHSSRQLRENDSGEMAAALTYRTIFGLVPLVMVSMLAFRLFGDMEQAAVKLQQAAYAFFNYQVDASQPEAAAFKEVLDARILEVVKTVSGLSFET